MSSSLSTRTLSAGDFFGDGGAGSSALALAAALAVLAALPCGAASNLPSASLWRRLRPLDALALAAAAAAASSAAAAAAALAFLPCALPKGPTSGVAAARVRGVAMLLPGEDLLGVDSTDADVDAGVDAARGDGDKTCTCAARDRGDAGFGEPPASAAPPPLPGVRR